jgi:hypothetical protein
MVPIEGRKKKFGLFLHLWRVEYTENSALISSSGRKRVNLDTVLDWGFYSSSQMS